MATNTERTVYIIELRDKFTKGMDRAARSTNRFNKSTERVKKRTDGLTKSFNLLKVAAVGAAVYGIARMAKAVTDLVGRFQSVQVAFDVMLGDVLGGRMMDWAKEFSRTTVITFEQTVTSIRKLLAYGLPEATIRPLTKALSEIAAGVGTDRLPYLTLALGQVYSRGRLMGTELRQFREHGVDIVSEVAKGLGLSTAKIEEMVTKGQIPFQMVADAMMSMTEAGGRFHGILSEAAKKWEGVTAIMKSTKDLFLVEFFDPIVTALTGSVVKVTDILQELRELDFKPMQESFMEVLSTMFKMDTGDNSWLMKRLAQAGAIFLQMYTVVADYVMLTVKSIAKAIVHSFNWLRGHVLDAVMFGKGPGAWIKTDAAYELKNIPDMWREAGEKHIQLFKDIYNLGAKKLPTGEAEDTAATAVKTVIDEEEGKSKTRKTNRLVGTGARDIIINIGNLIENVTNNNAHYANNLEAMQEQLTKTLLTAVNDVTLLAEA